MGLVARLIVSALNMKVFSYLFHDILPRLRVVKIQSCHRALGWRAGEYLVRARF